MSRNLNPFIRACRGGLLDEAQRLADSLDISPDDARAKDNWALLGTCANGHLETARWLVNTFGLTSEDARSSDNFALLWACINEHAGVALWLLDWLELSSDERDGVLSRVPNPSPEISALLTDWTRPPGPEDKPALAES